MAKLSSTQNRTHLAPQCSKEFLESVTDFASLSRGGLHSQHNQGRHRKRRSIRCEWCRREQGEESKCQSPNATAS
jgi:hypothetical protein